MVIGRFTVLLDNGKPRHMSYCYCVKLNRNVMNMGHKEHDNMTMSMLVQYYRDIYIVFRGGNSCDLQDYKICTNSAYFAVKG